jgi:uncharacterized repeat protein (TIGR03803 family)
LYSFKAGAGDGNNPYAGLVRDAAGNLYGTTYNGGAYGGGTVFELSPAQGGNWTEKILHSFNAMSNFAEGAAPQGGVILDAAGNLYGTTTWGGLYSSGTVFELSPTAGGNWTGQVLYTFGTNYGDGMLPESSLIFDAEGNLYGTTAAGYESSGTVFELTPTGNGNWSETVLYGFGYSGDGTNPVGGLVFDTAGNLYGTTLTGCDNDGGAVFQLTPQGGGYWTEQLLYCFESNGTDGRQPNAGLVIDSSGNLYGTATIGGTYNRGTVFELTPQGGGNWTETILQNFAPGDGATPYAGLMFDAAGNLYGAASGGGPLGSGTIFEMSSHRGSWTTRVLYSFNFNGQDGATPNAGLLFDSAGNLYGTTSSGGKSDAGAVFELAPSSGGGWTEKLLHSFGIGIDGANPQAGLVMDSAENLYSTTYSGGAYNSGTVFKLSPAGGGNWTGTVLYSFKNDGTDGTGPSTALAFDAAGNLYGTTYQGGTYNYGTVFQLSPSGSGNWTEQVLHSFNFSDSDGFSPEAGLIVDAAGNLYGTTYFGGRYMGGTVFEFSPAGGGNWTEQILYGFGASDDGADPMASLVFDTAGNLYGTTDAGGTYNWGTVFELSPSAGGWTEQVLYNFNSGADGYRPQASLVMFGSQPALYGTTLIGGNSGAGTVFKLALQEGNWTETVLHSFGCGILDGANPQAPVIFDRSGAHLYGTTSAGRNSSSFGTVFEVTP